MDGRSIRRGLVRRVGAAGMALAAVLVLGGCRATGGGFIGVPLDGGPVGVFKGNARFGFTFRCDMETVKKKPQAVTRGQITYHDRPSSITFPGDRTPTSFPEIRLIGTVEPLVGSCADADKGLPAALFQGTYRPQDTTLRNATGKFVVHVFDQGERGASRGEITGDGFSIELIGGAYDRYTRGGYIEGGNVQVKN